MNYLATYETNIPDVDTYASIPEKKVDAAVNALSIWPGAPCCGGPAGCGSIDGAFVVRPAPKSAKGLGAMV
jgi:hypothetical protein